MIKFLPIVFVVVLFSCKTTPSLYQDKEVDFNVTDKFKIRKAKTFRRNHATYIRIDYKQSTSDEYISLTWLPGKVDLSGEIANFIDSRISIYQNDPNGQPVVGEPFSTTFATNEARRIDYTIPHEGKFGSYIAFHCESATVIVGQHYAITSEPDSKKCLQTIEESLKCR